MGQKLMLMASSLGYWVLPKCWYATSILRLGRWLKWGFLAGLSYYTEYLAMFPNRAGAEVAYLEQAYARPKFLCVQSAAASCGF